MKTRTRIAAGGALVSFAIASSASANLLDFIETFDTGAANWRNFDGSAELDWFPSGGPDGSAYASSVFNLTNFTGGFPPVVIRAQTNFNSSNSAYAGDWIAAGVTGVSFDIRHDAPEAVSLTGRFATPANRGASTETAFQVQPGVWTTISIDLTEGSPDIISLGGLSYQAIFSNIGNIQLGFEPPANLAGQNIDVRIDIDNFALVPAPGTAALGLIAGLAAVRRRR
ncbi:MAG: hypothetical protein EA423_07140 [Phycisphaerales bacterium]|nr:MAG: hypothetical protein EA423_07140 [Phycisphaerales bacterium]